MTHPLTKIFETCLTLKLGVRHRILFFALTGLISVGLHAQQEESATSASTSDPAATNAAQVVDAEVAAPSPTNVTATVPSIASTNALSIHVTTNDLARTKLEARVAELANDGNMDEALKTALTQQYQAILERLRVEADDGAKQAEFVKLRAEAPTELRRIQEALEGEEPVLPKEADSLGSVGDLQARLAQYETELSVARGRLSELQGEPQKRSDRRIEITQQLAELRSRIEQSGGVESQTGEAAELTGARKLLSLAEHRALTSQIAAKTQEIAYYDAAKDLLNAQMEGASKRVEVLQKQVEAWREFIARQRAAAVQAGVTQAGLARRQALALARNHDLVVKVADENDRLLALRAGEQGLTKRIEVTAQELTEVQGDLKSLRESYQRISDRIRMLESANVKIGKTIALLLRHELLRLRSYETSQIKQQTIEKEISTTLSDAIRFQEDRLQLSNVSEEAQQFVLEYLQRTGTAADDKVETAVRNLLEARRDYLDALIADQNLLVSQLVNLKATSRDLEQTAVQYADFIRERILWLRSASPWSLQGFLDACGQLVREFPKAEWRYARESLLQDFSLNTWIYLLIFLALPLLLIGRGRMNRTMVRLCEQAEDRSLNSMSPTFKALGIVALIGLVWTGWIVLLGWRLFVCGSDTLDEFTQSMGRTLLGAGFAFWFLEFFRVLCRPDGVGETHLGWKPHNARLVRRNVLWLILTILPIRLVAEVVLWHMDEVRHLEQTVYAVSMALALVFAYRMLNPKHGLQLGSVPESGVGRRRVTWRSLLYGLSILLPVALAITALRGYYYSAWAIGLHVGSTIRLILLVYLGRSILYRWLLVLRRRMAVRLGERYQQAKLQAETSGEKAPAAPPRKISLMEIIQQSQQLVRAGMVIAFAVGLYGIWGDFIPALNALDRVPLKFWDRPALIRAFPGQSGGFSMREDGLRGSLNDASGPAVSENSQPANPPSPAASAENPLAMMPGMQAMTGQELVGGERNAASPRELGDMVTVADLLWAMIVIAVSVVAVRNLPGLLQVLLLNRVQLKPGVGYAIITVVRYSLTILGVLIVCATMGISWAKVQWIAAAFSLGIAFGLQEIFANFISGLIILFERPVRVGDIVTVGEVSGNVTRINIRATTITDWDRREYLVPNREFITSKLLNWTLSDPITRIMLTVGVAYGSDTDLAQKLLLEAAKECEPVMEDPAPRAIFWEFGDNSLNFRLYAHIPRRDFFLDVTHGLTTSINRKFAEAGITIAFPQRDVHLNQIGPIKVQVLPNPTKSEPEPES